jgi:hypothetical protein
LNAENREANELSQARTLRDRHVALSFALVRAAGAPPFVTARRLVQVYDGGAMPTEPNHVYLTHPVELNGAETEGGAASAVVDASVTIPVIVLWSAPQAGDLLTAYAVGGRWVAERPPSGPGSLPCGTCRIPRRNLTVSWTNSILGNGSTTLVYSRTPTQWSSGCSNEQIYRLLCTDNQVEFRVIYFISGSCPGGVSQFCSTLGVDPLRLVVDSLVCGDHFLLTCHTTGTSCPSITLNGYSSFTISA